MTNSTRVTPMGNLSLILRLIHRNRRISRSEIGRLSGLTRSSVANLVSQACQKGFAREEEVDSHDRVGRPSLEVVASDHILALAIHPEVDFLSVKAVAFNGDIVAERRIAYRTPVGPDQTITDIVNEVNAIVADLAAMNKGFVVAGAGVIVPGQVDLETGVVIHAPHLGWFDIPLHERLSAHLDFPLALGNDSALGCRAEIIFGAAKGTSEVVYLHGSSGIGGGAYTRGDELKGQRGIVAEFGHIRISSNAQRDYSGIPGTLEALVRREDLEKVLGLAQVSDEVLETTLLQQRSPASTALAKQQIEALAIGTATLVNIFNPEVVVLSGFLRSLYRFDQSYFHDQLRIYALPSVIDSLRVFVDELGSSSVAIGAAELVFDSLMDNPRSMAPL